MITEITSADRLVHKTSVATRKGEGKERSTRAGWGEERASVDRNWRVRLGVPLR